MDNIDKVRMELAHKYYALAEVKPDLKVDLFGSDTPEIDLNRIQRVAIFKTRQDGIQCVATIDGQSCSPQRHSTAVATDVGGGRPDGYKRHLAATLFADVLQRDNPSGNRKRKSRYGNRMRRCRKIGRKRRMMKICLRNGSFGTTSRKSIPTPCI